MIETIRRFRLTAAALVLPMFVLLMSSLGIFWTTPAVAEQPVTTLATLLDRAQIEDLLVDYYGHLGGGGGDFGAFYVADGVLDVNGLIAQGQAPIEALYKKIAEGTPPRKGAFRMLLTNPRIVVNGDTATADVIWTGVNSETVSATPQFVEQGREHDELVKRNGHWYFKRRIITSDGGLPPMFEKTYKKR
jgi:SnoaL-like domain